MKLSDLKKDLRTLSGLLRDWKNVKNPNVLQNIPFTEKNKGQINYSIIESEPLIFINIDLDRHCVPLGIEKLGKDKLKTLEVKLTTTCVESNEDSETKDPIESLGVKIVVEIVFSSNDGLKDANCSWHLDKGAPKDAKFSHPLYHLNFGGSHMTKQGDVFGKLLLLASPRVIHPPMDIILSCDFIIRNFYQIEKHKTLTENPRYISVLNSAKLRYWKPYSNAFSSNWHSKMIIENLSGISILGHL